MANRATIPYNIQPAMTKVYGMYICQRCQHSIFEMLNDFEAQPKKCLIYDEMVKNFQFFA